MSELMVLYTILVGTLAGIMAEEVRDPRYIPLLGSTGLTLFGALLYRMGSQLIPLAFIPITEVALAILAILVGFVFFRDLRRITKIRRDTILCLRHATEFLELKSSMRSAVRDLRGKLDETVSEIALLADTTIKSIEEMSHG